MASNTVNIQVILDESQVAKGARKIKGELDGLSGKAGKAGDAGRDAGEEAAKGADEAAKAAKGAGEEAEKAGEKAKGAGKKGSEGGEEAGRSWEKAGKQIKDASEKVKGVGDSLTKAVTAPMAAAAGASVKAAVDIDTSLTNVRKTVDGTEEDYQALKEAALEFSRTNAVSASELLDIEALGAQLGFTLDKFENGKTQVQEFGEVVSGLDIATNMSAEQAGTELAQFFNIMGEGKENVSNYASALVGLGNSFATTESDISAMAMRIAGAGKNIGLSSADVLGLATALSSLGIEAEAGGTAISTVMSDIDKSVALGSENLATWAETANMSVDDFKQAWGEDAVGTLDAVFKGMAQNVDEGGNMAVMLDELGISSIRQTDMMKRLANSGDLMTSAIGKANEEWRSNTALSSEVANRNDSLAAKFEMLKNRVTEVAIEVGEPLADALMDAIGAAEPLIQAVSDGARAFSEMDEGQQRAIISAAGMVAALGPLLSLAGRIGGSVGGAVETFGELALKLEKAGGAGAVAMKALGGFARFTPAALGITAVTGAIIYQADYMAKQAEHAEMVGEATNGMAEAMMTAEQAMSGSIPATQRQAEANDELAVSADDALRAQADLANGIRESWQDLGGKRSMLAEAVETIEELAGNCEGSSEKLSELNEAVAIVNEVTGANIEVTDGQTGALSTNTEEIRKNAEAWIDNAEKQAAANQLVQLKEQELQNMQAIGTAQQELADLTAEYGEAMKAAGDDVEAKSAVEIKYADKLQNSRDALQELNDAQAENASAQDYLKSKIDGSGASLEAQATSIRDLILQDAKLGTTLASTGTSAQQAAEHLQSMGLSAEQAGELTSGQLSALATMSDEAFGALLESADGSIDGVIGKLGELDDYDPAVHHVTVTDDGTIAVVERATGNVIKVLGSVPGKTEATVTDNGTASKTKQEADKAKGSLNSVKGTYTASVSVSGVSSAKSALGGLVDSLNGFAGRIFTAYTQVVSKSDHAAGGFFGTVPAHAAGGFMGGIPCYASGAAFNGILTRATMTSAGIAGEKGREALLRTGRNSSSIVPLENRQYMKPFADAVASAMGGRLSSPVYNITLDWHADSTAVTVVNELEHAIRLARLQEEG